MSTLTTSEDIEQDKADRDLDASYNNISAFVCETGPRLLTRGMPPLEANQALLMCLNELKRQRDYYKEIAEGKVNANE